MPHCSYKQGRLFKESSITVDTMAHIIPKFDTRSGIPDILHWMKRLYKHDEDKIPLIMICLGVIQPGTLNPPGPDLDQT